MSIRKIRRMMRGDLHRKMSIPAFYIPVPSADPTPCTVRVWRKREDPMLGDQPGSGGSNWAEATATEDRIRFDLSEIPVLRRLAVVSVEAGEAYRIDHLYPADLGYQTARVIPLSAAEAGGLPVPEIIL